MLNIKKERWSVSGTIKNTRLEEERQKEQKEQKRGRQGLELMPITSRDYNLTTEFFETSDTQIEGSSSGEAAKDSGR